MQVAFLLLLCHATHARTESWQFSACYSWPACISISPYPGVLQYRNKSLLRVHKRPACRWHEAADEPQSSAKHILLGGRKTTRQGSQLQQLCGHFSACVHTYMCVKAHPSTFQYAHTHAQVHTLLLGCLHHLHAHAGTCCVCMHPPVCFALHACLHRCILILAAAGLMCPTKLISRHFIAGNEHAAFLGEPVDMLIISSPCRELERAIHKHEVTLTLYMPLCSLEELHSMRSSLERFRASPF